MSTETKAAHTPSDGGPAFPILDHKIGYHADIRQMADGMSLRDWFAGQVLAGEIAATANDQLSVPTGSSIKDALQSDAKRRADWCYLQADAMLAARALTPQPEGR